MAAPPRAGAGPTTPSGGAGAAAPSGGAGAAAPTDPEDAGVADDEDAGAAIDAGSGGVPTLLRGLIQFRILYSAFGGEQTYQLTPSVPLADPASSDEDRLDPASLKWSFDSDYVTAAPYAALPGAILLTTQKAGATVIKVTARRQRDNAAVRGEAQISISQVDQDDLAAGEARYDNGEPIDWTQGDVDCELDPAIIERLPTNSACANCHSTMSPVSYEYTPTQTAGYSDDELIEIYTRALLPREGHFNTPFLKSLPMPECAYRKFHTWELDDATMLGLVYKLRSLTPRTVPVIDFVRLVAEPH